METLSNSNDAIQTKKVEKHLQTPPVVVQDEEDYDEENEELNKSQFKANLTGGLLSDTNTYSALRIRQRMKLQQARQYRGKRENNTAIDKENNNVHPSPSVRMISNGQSNSNPPLLTLTVTMSEDNEDNDNANNSVAKNKVRSQDIFQRNLSKHRPAPLDLLPSHLRDSSDTLQSESPASLSDSEKSQNVSAWAMVEHYPKANGSASREKLKQDSSEGVESKENSFQSNANEDSYLYSNPDTSFVWRNETSYLGGDYQNDTRLADASMSLLSLPAPDKDTSTVSAVVTMQSQQHQRMGKKVISQDDPSVDSSLPARGQLKQGKMMRHKDDEVDSQLWEDCGVGTQVTFAENTTNIPGSPKEEPSPINTPQKDFSYPWGSLDESAEDLNERRLATGVSSPPASSRRDMPKTPAACWNEWQQEQREIPAGGERNQSVTPDDDDIPEDANSASLLQLSLLPSEPTLLTMVEEEEGASSSSPDLSQIRRTRLHNMTDGSLEGQAAWKEEQLSMESSMQPTEPGIDAPVHSWIASASTALTPVDEPKDAYSYQAKIQELQSSLQKQETMHLSETKKLHEKVSELQRAIVLTPRGTQMQNPIETLLERNKTLVQEVRFADQTCVELSTKNSALEQEVKLLQSQIKDLEKSNDQLQSKIDDQAEELLQAEQALVKLEGEKIIDNFDVDNSDDKDTTLVHDNASMNTDTDVTILNILKELKFEVGALDPESFHPEGKDGFVDSDKKPNDNASVKSAESWWLQDLGDSSKSRSPRSHILAKALQAEVRRLHKDAMKKSPSYKTEKELQESKLQVEELKAQVDMLKRPQPEDDKLRKENDFLGRQLGKVQEQLEASRAELTLLKSKQDNATQDGEDENEAVWYLKKESQTSPRLRVADKRVFALEKELTHAQASVQAMQREAERWRNMATSASKFAGGKHQEQAQNIMKITQSALSQIMAQYDRLDKEVKNVVDSYEIRLARMVSIVQHMRSTLHFESDSVTFNAEASGPVDATLNNNNNRSSKDAPFRDADEILEWMEEARSPPSVVRGIDSNVSTSSDWDMEMSRFDDATLESIKLGFVNEGASVSSNNTAFEKKMKESLRVETALHLCRTLRERITQLQQDAADERVTWHKQREEYQKQIQNLESENGRLSLDASRRCEEKVLLEREISEAKLSYEELQARLHEAKSELTASRDDVDNREHTIRDLQGRISEVEKQIKTSEDRQVSIQKQLDEVIQQKEMLENELKDTIASLKKAEQKYIDLEDAQKLKQEKLIAGKDEEVKLLREALQQTESELSQLKRDTCDTDGRLQKALKQNSNYSAVIAKLQASREEYISVSEDRILEAQSKLEDMRTERAALKSRLGHTEKDLIVVKESLATFKARTKEQLDEKETTLRSLQNERSVAMQQLNQLAALREELVGSLQRASICSDVLQRVNEIGHDNESNPLWNEVRLWNEIVPTLGKSVESMSQRTSRFDELEGETRRLAEAVSKQESLERHYKLQLDDTMKHNNELCSLLNQAGEDMEKFRAQYNEVSVALSTSKDRESAMHRKLELMEEDFNTKTRTMESRIAALAEERQTALSRLCEAETSLGNMSGRVSQTEKELSVKQDELQKLHDMIRNMEDERQKLLQKIDGLQQKGVRLREYIRKLTNKCEEWEASYDRQSKVLDKLQERNNRTRQKAQDLAHRYQKLTQDINRRSKVHNEDRAKWSTERTNLHNVHTQLEEELEIIAKELSAIDSAWK